MTSDSLFRCTMYMGHEFCRIFNKHKRKLQQLQIPYLLYKFFLSHNVSEYMNFHDPTEAEYFFYPCCFKLSVYNDVTCFEFEFEL